MEQTRAPPVAARHRQERMKELLRNLFTGARREGKKPRIFCHFNHYFGPAQGFLGRSTSGDRDGRAGIVQAAINQIRALPFEVDLRVCGFRDYSLLPVDLDLSDIGNPLHIIYRSIERMFESTDKYDYFLNIEDDILIDHAVLQNSMAFAAVSGLNEVFLPNRMERQADGTPYCVDLVAMPGWRGLHRTFRKVDLDVAVNPHSGLFFLSRDQMRFARTKVDLARRDVFIGEAMPSAYANVHAPFLLWRAKSEPLAHHVVHLDKWLESPT